MYKLDSQTIELSMLPEEQQAIAELIGVDAFLRLCQQYGGSNLYIPKKDRVTRHIRDIKINREFDGANYKELARKYKLSESHVRKIVGNVSAHQQTDIFEFLGE